MNSMRASVESRIDNIVGAADLRVIDENASRFPEEDVSHLADLPGVRQTGARLGGSLTLTLKDGEKDEFGRDRRLTVGARGAKWSESRYARSWALFRNRRSNSL